MDENRLGFANPINVSEITIQNTALESNDNWKVLRGQPKITNIQEFITLYDYVCELSTITVSGADYRALRNKSLDYHKVTPQDPSGKPGDERGSEYTKQGARSREAASCEARALDMDSQDPFERQDLADHWYTLQSRAIECGLKRNAESHQAAWLFCRLGVGGRNEFLKRKELVRNKYNLSDKRIRVILAKIDKLVLSAFEKIVAVELYKQNKTKETEIRLYRKKKK